MCWGGGRGEGEKGTFVEVRPSCERRWACFFVVRSIVFSGRALEKRFLCVAEWPTWRRRTFVVGFRLPLGGDWAELLRSWSRGCLFVYYLCNQLFLPLFVYLLMCSLCVHLYVFFIYSFIYCTYHVEQRNSHTQCVFQTRVRSEGSSQIACAYFRSVSVIGYAGMA